MPLPPDTTPKAGEGAVAIRSHVRVLDAGLYDYALGYSGPDAANVHWLQFVHAELVVRGPDTRWTSVPGTITAERQRPLPLTQGGDGDKPGKPGMTDINTDAFFDGRSPFYDVGGGTASRLTGWITIYDRPTPLEADAHRELENGATAVMERFHVDAFVVKEGFTRQVTYRVQLTITNEWTTPTSNPAWSIKVDSAGPVTSLPAPLAAQLEADQWGKL